MTEEKKQTIHIPEICRVEGHAAVDVQIEGGVVAKVTLEVFEGARFFEKLMTGHHFDEIPHITSRVCAICSTGHVLAAAFAIENIIGITIPDYVNLFRELMHLGMIIECKRSSNHVLKLNKYY